MIVNKFKEYFAPEEVVSKEVFTRHGFNSYNFICPMLMEVMVLIREGIDKPITINNWKWGGQFSQRGLRENTGYLSKNRTLNNQLYLSAHTLGKAFDFDVQGMKADEVREWIEANQDNLPYKVRLERNFKGNRINWVHLDVIQDERLEKVYFFDV